ncbi:MAG: hypothetical protein GX352_04650 [Clostridiales bacterium]|nr:hypothetical protein [Clostridiales bacterium]
MKKWKGIMGRVQKVISKVGRSIKDGKQNLTTWWKASIEKWKSWLVSKKEPASESGHPIKTQIQNVNRWWKDSMKSWKGWLASLKRPKSRPKDSSKVQDDKDIQEDSEEKGSKFFLRKKRQPNFFISVLVTTIRLFLILFILIGFASFGAVAGIGKAYLDSTPELDVVRIEDQNETTFIYDKFGNLITEYYGFENRIWAPIDEIPDNLRKAFIAIEDARFESHNGIDAKRVFGSLIHNLSSDTTQGASTITQQLIKNTILTQEVTYKRKIQEMYLAVQLEKKYSKDQILEAYLNTIWLGGSNYGVKAAAKDYFGKELRELTLQECAMLAGITRNPWGYDPRANTYTRDTPEKSYDRTNLVLQRMYESNFINEDQYKEAMIEESRYNSRPITIKEKPSSNDYPMKYFLEYVIDDVRERIMVLNNWEGDEGWRKADQYIYSGGLHIYTTLDPKIQQAVEEEVYEYKSLPKFEKSIYNKSESGVDQPQAAVVVIEQNTGELQAIVGGKQPPTGKRQFNRAFNPKAQLPIGSTIKPLAVYAPFIEAGYPGGIIIENIPAAIDGWKHGELPYPRNYGDSKYDGPTDVRKGIFKSLNVVAARILLDRIGTSYSVEKMKELGFNPKHIPEEPAALSLGAHGNIMMEVAGAYAALANKGVYREPVSFTKVIDKDGNEILNTLKNQITRQVFKESTAFILTDWMQDVVNGGTATVHIRNDNGQAIPVAGKTGTNSQFRGVYFAGYTPYYTATLWIGHDDFQPPFVKGTTGGKFAAPLWEKIMNRIHANLENKDFYDEVPEDVVRVTVCGVSGKLPNGELCARDSSGHGLVTEWFPKNAVPKPDDICNMHVEIEACPYSGKYPTPYCPEEGREKSAIILLPKDSPYRLLSDSELAKYLPGAVKDLDKLGKLDYKDPNDRPYFCNLHTKEWYEGEQLREEMIIEASQLIANVKSNMANPTYAPKLDKKRSDKLNKSIGKLEEALKEGIIEIPDKSSKEHKHIDKLPVFDGVKVQEEMDHLSKINKEIFKEIEKELENDKPNNPSEPPVNGEDPPDNGNGDDD